MQVDIGRVASRCLAALLFIACGGDGSAQGPADTAPPSPKLNFAPIAGDWAGVMTTPGG